MAYNPPDVMARIAYSAKTTLGASNTEALGYVHVNLYNNDVTDAKATTLKLFPQKVCALTNNEFVKATASYEVRLDMLDIDEG